MKDSKSLLKSKPPLVAKMIIYFAALILLVFSLATLMSINGIVDSWYLIAASQPY